VASIDGVIPGTSVKGVPREIADRNALTDEAGNPAAMSFGGTSLGIVFPRRLVRMAVYIADPIVDTVER
jgi:hypothetical protein